MPTPSRLEAPCPRQPCATHCPPSRQEAARLSLLVEDGGATGIETAAEVASASPHIKVRLISREPMDLFLNKSVGSSIRRRLLRLGVEIIDQVGVTAVRAYSVVTDQGDELACDLCIWTGGFVAPPLAREAGLAVNERNLQAIQTGEMTPLMEMLAEDVTMWTDGGGKVKGAATRPITGREAVARFSLAASKRFLPEGARVELAEVNGQPGLIIRVGDRAYRVMTIEVEAQRIRAIRIIANPEKLARV
jgi:hypothetical protein